jgi:hypothetical protein
MFLRNVCEFVPNYTALRREDRNLLVSLLISKHGFSSLCSDNSGLVPRAVSYLTFRDKQAIAPLRSTYRSPGNNHADSATCSLVHNAMRLTSGVEKVYKTTDAAVLRKSDKVRSYGQPLTYYVVSVRGQGKRCCVVNIQKKVKLKRLRVDKCDAL